MLTDAVATSQHDDLFAVMADMDAAHPKGTHWYLPWFGVDAAIQGTGLGSELLAASLNPVDEPYLPACLDTPHGAPARPMTFMQREAH